MELQQPRFTEITPLSFRSHLSADEYCQKVLLAQKEIAAGNIYQVCLAHRFQAAFNQDPWPYYLALRKKSPAPFAAYLQLGHETILSTSPECFLRIEGDKINTYPIKGTRPRGRSQVEDAQQRWELQHSPKEKAELIMITDLERNDLSQICEYGSVTTPELLELKSYPHLYHLVSRVQGKLRKSISHVEAVAACFPGGSISGVPKKKALEIIDRLEPVPRGLFTGAIGYFGFDGSSQFSIAIRTLVIHNACAEFHVGAGITSDSIPHEEWKETLKSWPP
jgi:anthranilate/para-aminobenzoate synthase component I